MSKQKNRRTLRRLLFLTAVAAGIIAPALPAHAAGYCVDAYPQPGYGDTVCIPWGG